jgi:L-fuconolactonase
MLRIDSHQHFWKYDPVTYSWIDDRMQVIQKDFLPLDLELILMANGFDGCITVQSEQTEAENEFQLTNAAKYDFIKGVVGWVDLQSPQIESRLEYYTQFDKLKGFRHILQGEPRRDLMLTPAFLNGISLLKQYNYTYDVLILPDQLGYTADFVSRFPDQPFVIDHLAKPDIKNGELNNWKKQIEAVSKFENVYCKVSGMVTEADWDTWKPNDFYPYLDVLVKAFGINRLMYGSDWPVCNVAADYEQVVGIVKDYFSAFTQTEQESFFGGNTIEFYNILK